MAGDEGRAGVVEVERGSARCGPGPGGCPGSAGVAVRLGSCLRPRFAGEELHREPDLVETVAAAVAKLRADAPGGVDLEDDDRGRVGLGHGLSVQDRGRAGSGVKSEDPSGFRLTLRRCLNQ